MYSSRSDRAVRAGRNFMLKSSRGSGLVWEQEKRKESRIRPAAEELSHTMKTSGHQLPMGVCRGYLMIVI